MSFAIFFPVEQSPLHSATSNLPTCSVEDSSFPAFKTASIDPTDVFKPTSSPAILTWDLGQSRLINCVALLSADLDSSATILVETSLNGTTWTTRSNKAFWAHITTATSFTGAGESTDPLGRYNQRNFSFWYDSAGISARYVRVTITATLTWTISRFYIGRAFAPVGRYQYGSSIEFIDTGTKDRTERGAPIMDPGYSLVNAKIKLEFINKSEMFRYLYELNHWRQSTKDILVCLDVTDQANLQRSLFYGTLANGRQINFDSYERYSQELIIESL